MGPALRQALGVAPAPDIPQQVAQQQRAAPMVSNRQGSDYMFDNQGPLSRVIPAARLQAPEGPAPTASATQPQMNIAEALLRSRMAPKPPNIGELAAREVYNYARDLSSKIPSEKDPKVRKDMEKEARTLFMGLYKPQAIAPTYLYGQPDEPR
jgi:hypothetical protein